MTYRPFLIMSGLIGLTLSAATLAAEPLQIYAPASLQRSLDQLTRQWQAQHGETVHVTYATSNELAGRIEQGARPDLVMTDDIPTIEKLSSDGLIRKDSNQPLLGTGLAVVVPSDTDTQLSIQPHMDLSALLQGSQRVAMCNPSAPAGAFAESALKQYDAWDAIAGRITAAATEHEALEQVATGHAPVGVVYAAEAQSDPRVRIIGNLSAATYSPIVYSMAITAVADHPQATSLKEFLQSADAKNVYAKNGFTVLSQVTALRWIRAENGEPLNIVPFKAPDSMSTNEPPAAEKTSSAEAATRATVEAGASGARTDAEALGSDAVADARTPPR